MRFAAVLCLVLLGACGSIAPGDAPPARPKASLGTEFELALGESIDIAGTQVTIAFENVLEDSRCPMNARCIWEGNAKIAVQMLGSIVELNTSTRFATKQELSGFAVELRRLEPGRLAGAQTSGYIAILSVGATL